MIGMQKSLEKYIDLESRQIKIFQSNDDEKEELLTFENQ